MFLAPFLTEMTSFFFFFSGCIGEKFFEGVINFQFQKRLKRHLAECVSFYQKQYDEAKMEENSNRKLLFEANLGYTIQYNFFFFAVF